jgi:acetyltransferase-like isoleucine patch superfamily enzyme
VAKILLPLYAFLIFGLPAVVASTPVLFAPNTGLRMFFVALAPFLYGITYVLNAGALSWVGKRAMIRGKFPRDLSHPVYGPRRLHAFCWTSVCYFTPLYHAFLSFPKLKGLLFRLFGYAGPLDFTITADVWVRDLPLNSFGKGAYLANRATIGSNLCLMDGTTLVDGIHIEEGALVGHLCLLAPGVKMGKGSEAGVHTAVGIRTQMKAGSKTLPCVTLYHGTSIGENVEIGSCSYIGLRSKIAANIKIPAGANIPAGVEINSQADVENYYTSETAMLRQIRMTALNEIFNDKEAVSIASEKTADEAS